MISKSEIECNVVEWVREKISENFKFRTYQKERIIDIYPLQQISIIGANKGISKVACLACKELIIYFETQVTQILNTKYSRGSCVPLGERMYLPDIGYEVSYMFYHLLLR